MGNANRKQLQCMIVEVPDDVVRDTDYSFAKKALEARRNHKPPITFEQMKADLEREIVIYALGELRNQGVIDQVMYENAVNIATKKLKAKNASSQQPAP